MTPPLGYSREGDVVTLRLTADQYNSLLLKLGYAMGAATGRGEETRSHLALVNAINAGNPNFTPYKIPEDAPR